MNNPETLSCAACKLSSGSPNFEREMTFLHLPFPEHGHYRNRAPKCARLPGARKHAITSIQLRRDLSITGIGELAGAHTVVEEERIIIMKAHLGRVTLLELKWTVAEGRPACSTGHQAFLSKAIRARKRQFCLLEYVSVLGASTWGSASSCSSSGGTGTFVA